MYLIKNGILHVGDGSTPKQMDILTEGGKIKKIGEQLSEEGAEVINVTGCHVFPGFIDPHSVIGAMGIPGRYLDHNEATNPITPEMNIRYSVDPDEVNAQEFYKSGITAVGLTPGNANVMGGQITVYKTAPAKMSERTVKDGAALKCSVTEDVKRTYGERNQIPKTRMGIFHLMKEAIRGAKTAGAEERSTAQQVICDVFEEKKMPVFVAASTKGEIDGILHSFAEEKIQMCLTEAFCFSDCIEEMKRSKAGLILGNINNMSQIAKNKMDISRIQELIDNGNLIAFSNTNGGSSEGREVFLWNAIEVYRAGVPAEEIVKMMTANPAKMLGVDDRLGTLEEGKDADISVFTAHPVTSYAARVRHSIINGEVIF